MAKEHYELLALFMRYWFVFLIVMIVWRAVRQMLKEKHQQNKVLRSLPDAGLVGEIVDVNTGEAYPLPREGFISSRASADIRLKNLNKNTKLHFEFVESKGIQLSNTGRNSDVFADGVPVKSRPYALHGTYLEMGSYVLRFRLFEGLSVPQRENKPREEEYNPALENTWTFAVEPPEYEAPYIVPSGADAYNAPSGEYSEAAHGGARNSVNKEQQNAPYPYKDYYEDVNLPEQEELFDDGAYFHPANYNNMEHEESLNEQNLPREKKQHEGQNHG